jgi:UDP-N-acetylmuramoylalanine--D-glutamate ligase
MPDHMNYYKGDMDRYFRDKAAIARFQKSGDYLITTPNIKEKIESRFGKLAATTITDGTLPADWKIALLGEHNRQNAVHAGTVARCLGIPDDVIKKVLTEFKGLPFRLEFLGEKNGIAFYNDSNSTTPEATLAALATLGAQSRPIVLIAGGSDKELVLDELALVIAKIVKSTVLFEGKATEKLKALLPKDLPVTTVANMSDAAKTATRSAKPGDIVLLSPAATSFGIFKNEYDRGEQFTAIVNALK